MKRLLITGALAPLVLALGVALTATGSGALDPPTTTGAVICQNPDATASPVQEHRPAARWAGTTLSAEQLHNARIIRDVGIALGIPARGQVIAVATAMTESGLRNLSYGDADSLGLFQQRPSSGWGTPQQITDPIVAATSFYRALEEIPGWAQLPLTVAAQRVQRSAYPDRYAAWEPLATAVITSLAGTETLCVALDAEAPLTGDTTAALPTGFTLPTTTPLRVRLAIGWALAQLGTPYHFGGDCTAARSGIPARQCDCSSLVILSSLVDHCRELRCCVKNGVVDATAGSADRGCAWPRSLPRCDAVTADAWGGGLR